MDNFDRYRSTQTTSVVIPGRIIPWSDCRLCPPHSHIHNRSGRCFKSMSKLGQTNSSSKDPQSRNKENSLLRLFPLKRRRRSEEHTSELQSLIRISYAVYCLKKKKNT